MAGVNDAFPGGVLADEILTPGPQQVRALFVTGGNPLVTMANAGRMRHALRAARPARSRCRTAGVTSTRPD